MVFYYIFYLVKLSTHLGSYLELSLVSVHNTACKLGHFYLDHLPDDFKSKKQPY